MYNGNCRYYRESLVMIPPMGLCVLEHELGKNVPDNGNALTCSHFGVRGNFSPASDQCL